MFDAVRRVLIPIPSTCLPRWKASGRYRYGNRKGVNIIWRHRQLDYNQTNPVWGESDAFIAAALASSDAIVP